MHKLVVSGNQMQQGNNNEFEGFIPDLLQKLSQRVGVTFDIKLVKDGKYGSRERNGSWNGMIGELVRGVRWLA